MCLKWKAVSWEVIPSGGAAAGCLVLFIKQEKIILPPCRYMMRFRFVRVLMINLQTFQVFFYYIFDISRCMINLTLTATLLKSGVLMFSLFLGFGIFFSSKAPIMRLDKYQTPARVQGCER